MAAPRNINTQQKFRAERAIAKSAQNQIDLVWQQGWSSLINASTVVTPALSVRLRSARIQQAIRDELGRFNRVSAEVGSVNQASAGLVIREMIAVLEERQRVAAAQAQARSNVPFSRTDRPRLRSIRHEAGVGLVPKTQTQRLRGVLEDQRNQMGNSQYIRAGIPEWMDRSPARAYWRHVNYGHHLSPIVHLTRGRGPRFTTRIDTPRVSPTRAFAGYRFWEEGALRGRRILMGRSGESIRVQYAEVFERLGIQSFKMTGGPGAFR